MKKSRSIYLLYLLSQLALAALAIAMIAVGVVSFIGETKWGLPTFYELENSIAITGGSTSADISFKKGVIEINGDALQSSAKVWIIGGFGLVFSCIAFGFYSFNRFMKGVYEGHTFATETIWHLKKCALALLAVSFSLFLLQMGSHLYVNSIVDLTGYRTKFEFSILFNPYLMGALFLWVLAHIFQKAKELEDDQKLTI